MGLGSYSYGLGFSVYILGSYMKALGLRILILGFKL